MKPRAASPPLVRWLLITLAWCSGWLSLAAVPYALDWYSVDGGGGTSSGGVYVMTSTIGQPDTAVLIGGPYQVQAGFWPGTLVPLGGEVPTLIFQFFEGELWISWDPDTPGFRLEQTDDLWLSEWISAPPGNPVVIPRSAGARFYRLRKP